MHLPRLCDRPCAAGQSHLRLRLHSPLDRGEESGTAVGDRSGWPNREAGRAVFSPPPFRGEVDRVTPNNGSAIINLDKETQSAPVSQDSKNAVPISPLPVDLGIYLRFEDPQWWEKVQDVMDIAETLRIISITRRRLSFPAIYNGKTREIEINCKGDSMTIRQGLDNSPSLDLKNIHPRGKIRAWFQQAHSENKWSLLRIRAGEVTDLKLSFHNIVLYYGQEFAECVWVLVHHHRNRGDEAYILIRKKDLTDD